MSNWISIKDRLPTGHEYDQYKKKYFPGVQYLVLTKATCALVCLFYNGKLLMADKYGVTHWQPLPELPDESEE